MCLSSKYANSTYFTIYWNSNVSEKAIFNEFQKKFTVQYFDYLQSKIKYKNILQHFLSKLINRYMYTFAETDEIKIIQNITDSGMRDAVLYHIVLESNDGHPVAMAAAKLITDVTKQQEAFFHIATETDGLEDDDEDGEDIVLAAAQQITDVAKQQEAFFHIATVTDGLEDDDEDGEDIVLAAAQQITDVAEWIEAFIANPLAAGEINPISFLEPALNVESARKQKLALKKILKEICGNGHESKKAIFNEFQKKFTVQYFEYLQSKIKDKYILQYFLSKLMNYYMYTFAETDEIKIIQNITDSGMRDAVLYHIVLESNDGHPVAMAAAKLITDVTKQQEAFFHIATETDGSYDDDDIVLAAAKLITDRAKQQEAYLKITIDENATASLKMVAAKQITDVAQRIEALLNITEFVEALKDEHFEYLRTDICDDIVAIAKPKDVECCPVWLEVANLLGDKIHKASVFKTLSKCRGGYGLKKQLDSLPLEPSAQQAKLEAMFSYPMSSHADDQAALLEIHQRLCLQAQSLDEKIKWVFKNKHNFNKIYENPSVPVAKRVYHLYFWCQLERDIRLECLCKPAMTDLQKGCADECLRYMQPSLTSVGSSLVSLDSITIDVLKKFLLEGRMKEKILRNLDELVINSQELDFKIEFMNGIMVKDLSKNPDMVENLYKTENYIGGGSFNLDLQQIQSLMNMEFNGFSADSFMEFLEAFEKSSLRFLHSLELLDKSFFKYPKMMNNILIKPLLRSMAEIYLEKFKGNRDEIFNLIVNRILESETLSKALQCKSLRDLFDARDKMRYSKCGMDDPLMIDMKHQFQLFLKGVDPSLESSPESLEILSSLDFIKKYINMLRADQLIEYFERIIDGGRRRYTKIAIRGADGS